jgi:hypothetical protein
LSDLPPVGQCVSHRDVELIALLPVEKSNKDVICRQLEAHIEKTGVPRLIVSLTITTESFVRQRGLYHGAQLELAEQLQYMAHTDRTQRVRTELVAFVEQESAKTRPGERFLGSSKVIESILGKLKRIEIRAIRPFVAFVISSTSC